MLTLLLALFYYYLYFYFGLYLKKNFILFLTLFDSFSICVNYSFVEKPKCLSNDVFYRNFHIFFKSFSNDFKGPENL